MHTQTSKQLKRKGLKILFAKLVVMYYLVYIFIGSQQRFHLSTSFQWSENKKGEKKIEKYKPLDYYGQTYIPFGEFTPMTTSHWKLDFSNCWEMNICAIRCKQDKVNNSLLLVKKNYMSPRNVWLYWK